LCPARVRDAMTLFGRCASLAMFGLLVWYGTRMAWDDFRFDVTSPALGAPQWFYSVWLPVLALAVGVRLAGQIWRQLRAKRQEFAGLGSDKLLM
jgi:TRAP-type transport system small permease protein